jgi:hypothetical protein
MKGKRDASDRHFRIPADSGTGQRGYVLTPPPPDQPKPQQPAKPNTPTKEKK